MINIPCEFHSAADCGSVILFRIGDLNLLGTPHGFQDTFCEGKLSKFHFYFSHLLTPAAMPQVQTQIQGWQGHVGGGIFSSKKRRASVAIAAATAHFTKEAWTTEEGQTRDQWESQEPCPGAGKVDCLLAAVGECARDRRAQHLAWLVCSEFPSGENMCLNKKLAVHFLPHHALECYQNGKANPINFRSSRSFLFWAQHQVLNSSHPG